MPLRFHVRENDDKGWNVIIACAPGWTFVASSGVLVVLVCTAVAEIGERRALAQLLEDKMGNATASHGNI